MNQLESEVLNEMHQKIVKNFLDTIILMELRKHSMNGYDVISFVHNNFHMLLSPGTVYSYLYSLERSGLIKGELAQKRRVYTLTPKGEETVDELLDSKDKILGLMLSIFVGA